MKYLKVAVLSGCVAFCSGQLAAAEYNLVGVAKSFDYPWCIAFLPDGDMLVTELAGNLRRVGPGGEISEPIAGVPEVFRMSQGGLFDVLLHPDFQRNQVLFLSYAGGPPGDNATEVVRARLEGDALVDSQVIFSVAPRKPTPVHYGGRMRFLGDGTLLLTTGDGFDFREEAQDRTSLLGKTVRMDEFGNPAPGNPYIGNTEGFHEVIWTWGHRNAQGLDVASDGTIYLNEHGPRGGDETNVLEPGANYGWPAVTFGMDYNGAYVSPFTTAPGMIDPLNYWVPSIGPSGLTIYEGDRFPEWKGDLFAGALVDNEVRRLDLEGGEVVDEEALFSELDSRIRDVRSHDGYLYIITDGPDGRIVRVEPAR